MCSKNRKKSKRVVSRRRRKTEFNQRSSRGKPEYSPEVGGGHMMKKQQTDKCKV